METYLDPIVLEWQCQKRGDCCRAWRIDVTPSELRAMATATDDAGHTKVSMRLLEEHLPDRRLDGTCAVPMTPDGACMFLENNLCGYRMKFSSETLPTTCRRFPQLGVVTPRRTLYGLSFSCPTALSLLVARPRLEIRAHDGDAPMDMPCDFRGADDGEEDPAAVAFWDMHWAWLERFRSFEGTPAQRLRALVREVADLELSAPTEKLPPWTSLGDDPSTRRRLEEAGADARVLCGFFDESSARRDPGDVGAVADEDALLGSYLEHRLMLPEFLMTGASLGRIIGVLFAAVARYRFERARGATAPAAIAHLDAILLHSNYVPGLFPDDVPEPDAWQTLAMLALAEVAPEPAT